MLTYPDLVQYRVANAGIAQVKGLLDVSEEDFQRMLSVNITGVHFCYSVAAKQMIKQKNLTKDNPGKLIAVSDSTPLSSRPLNPELMVYGCRLQASSALKRLPS